NETLHGPVAARIGAASRPYRLYLPLILREGSGPTGQAPQRLMAVRPAFGILLLAPPSRPEIPRRRSSW
ncbi:hypothetical protein, partial [Thermoflexus sp.]|uniref:hypothetical protein n=1 Tax=Thermoflexus sp. TaxID=1969742 RepID=UPI002ADE47C4